MNNYHKAEGFYRHVEWESRRGVLVRFSGHQVSFESGTYDVEYDQRVDGYRQVFLSRKWAIRFMLNLGMNLQEIAEAFRALDNQQVVHRSVA